MFLKSISTKTLFRVAIPLVLLGLTACADVPTRDTPNGFALRNSGRVDKTDIPALLECITDGFKNVPQSVWMNHFTNQERRKVGYRIEILHALGGWSLVSADIRDDGFAEVFESSLSLQGSVKEQGVAAFDSCLAKHLTTTPKV